MSIARFPSNERQFDAEKTEILLYPKIYTKKVTNSGYKIGMYAEGKCARASGAYLLVNSPLSNKDQYEYP